MFKDMVDRQLASKEHELAHGGNAMKPSITRVDKC